MAGELWQVERIQLALTLALMRTLVILPTFNEAATIEEVVRRSRHAVADAEILVIDDGSPDGTAALAEKVGKDIGRVQLLRRDRRLGLGDAAIAPALPGGSGKRLRRHG